MSARRGGRWPGGGGPGDPAGAQRTAPGRVPARAGRGGPHQPPPADALTARAPGPGRSGRARRGGVPAGRRARACTPGPPDAAPGPPPGLRVGGAGPLTWTEPRSGPTLPGCRGRLRAGSPRPTPLEVSACGSGEGAALAGQRAGGSAGATWARPVSAAPWGRPACSSATRPTPSRESTSPPCERSGGRVCGRPAPGSPGGGWGGVSACGVGPGCRQSSGSGQPASPGPGLTDVLCLAVSTTTPPM